jgi:hypothetical protein
MSPGELRVGFLEFETTSAALFFVSASFGCISRAFALRKVGSAIGFQTFSGESV